MITLKECQVLLDSQEIQRFSSLHITQQFDWHHHFELRVPIEYAGNAFEGKLGKILKINVRGTVMDQSLENSFSGLVVRIGAAKESLAKCDVLFYGQSPTFLLDKRSHNRSFSDKTLKQIVEEVLSAYPLNLLRPKINPGVNHKIAYCVQYQESDYQFLRRLANDYGEWFLFNGAELYFGKLPSGESAQMILGQNFYLPDLDLHIEPIRFKLFSYDYRQSRLWTGRSANASVSSGNSSSRSAIQASERLLNQESFELAKREIHNKNELDEWVKYRKNAQVNALVKFTGVSNMANLKIAKLINIEGAGEQDGRYLITAVSHHIYSGKQYENHFVALPAGITSPPEVADAIAPSCEMQLAVVEDNNDPDGFGRVRVRFLWQQAPEHSPWLRVVTMHGGADRGIYFLPEIGDQVLIGFEYNHPEKPFVMGSLYHSQTRPTEWQDRENNQKAIKSKSGNQILFDDSSGKETIHIFNEDKANEICLTLKGDGKITLKSNGLVEVIAKTVSVRARDDFEVSAKNVSIDAQSALRIKSAAGEVSLEGVTANLKASGKLKVDGGTLAEIKAAIIKLN